MKKLILLISILTTLNTFAQQNSMDKEKIKKEIFIAEKNFQDDLQKHGAEYAFHKYAAEEAVIKRGNDSLIIGKAAIKNYYSAPAYKSATAEWKPDFIDVSNDGTMAYTYGKYIWRMTDKEGKETLFEGIFHTVWKRMTNGEWKYVWD